MHQANASYLLPSKNRNCSSKAAANIGSWKIAPAWDLSNILSTRPRRSSKGKLESIRKSAGSKALFVQRTTCCTNARASKCGKYPRLCQPLCVTNGTKHELTDWSSYSLNESLLYERHCSLHGQKRAARGARSLALLRERAARFALVKAWAKVRSPCCAILSPHPKNKKAAPDRAAF